MVKFSGFFNGRNFHLHKFVQLAADPKEIGAKK